MLRCAPGHYRDSFCRIVYDVRRARLLAATKTITGWEYLIRHGETIVGINGGNLYATKEDAARAARSAIYDLKGPSQ